ncbi:MAG: serine/threonine protein phosphatase [Treponema sp.]|jgi:UDP-2,3-diacylglucosamine pyrophosphatase LpxH|nr:serine/threonine protein phosphatase [Treponema sp.]
MEAPFFSSLAAGEGLGKEGGMAHLDLRDGGKLLILSDLHMGCGPRDDLAANGRLLAVMLRDYYLPKGFILVLNGDIEELQRYRLGEINKQWRELFTLFDEFAAAGRFVKTLGNHDEDLVYEKNYSYPLYQALRVDTGQIPVFIYHGHQSSKLFTKYNYLAHSLVRYIFAPFGIRNVSVARSPYRRFSVEKKAYAFSLAHSCISIIGHTHRTLFESLGRLDYIKYEIERLCRDYTAAPDTDKVRIAAEVAALRGDLSRLRRSERRDVLRQSLYGDELPVPCLFNSGSAISRKGINALELNNDAIALVYWFTEGGGRRFVSRGNYQVEKVNGRCRAVLNHDRLDYIRARIELLGSPGNSGAHNTKS